jgi:hypothetical protein
MNTNINRDRRRQALPLPHALQSFQFVENPEESIRRSRFVPLKSNQLLGSLGANRGWESRIKHFPTVKPQ